MFTVWFNQLVRSLKQLCMARSDKQKDQNTEAKILQAARQVFQEKGFSGTRMQKIADEAGINKAMLHYYFRSKQELFDRIFQESLKDLLPGLLGIMMSSQPLEEKISKLVAFYTDLLRTNPFLPGFVLHEIRQNPDKFVHMLQQNPFQPSKIIQGFMDHSQAELEARGLQDVDPRHLFISVIAMVVFPFVAQPIVKAVFELDDAAFDQWVQERVPFVSDWMLRAIQLGDPKDAPAAGPPEADG